MIGKSLKPVIKEAVSLYNKEKLPSKYLTEKEGEEISNLMFYYFREYVRKPYIVEFRLDKLFTVKLRYAHIMKNFKEAIYEARNLNKKVIEQGCSEKLKEKIEANKQERRYLWILMKKSMHGYRDTAKYRRLVKLRALWKEKNTPAIYKETITKEGGQSILNQVGGGNKGLGVNNKDTYYDINN